VKKILIGMIFLFSLSSCGGGSNNTLSLFSNPRFIAASEDPVVVKGTASKIVYVSNFLSGQIIPINSENNEIMDTDLFNNDPTPLTVAKNLGKIFVRKSEDSSYSFDIFAVSEDVKALYKIRADAAGDSGKNMLGHSFVDIGPDLICTVSRPFFKDKDNQSTPDLSNIITNTATTIAQNWEIEYTGGDKAYKVKGSISGLQISLASENVQYTVDDGSLSFIIYSGSKETTGGDRFSFGVNCSKPLVLPDKPGNFILFGGKIFIAIPILGKVLVYQESDWSLLNNLDLNDGSGTPFKPSDLVEKGGQVYVSNGNGLTLCKIDPDTYSLSYYDVGEPVSSLSLDINLAERLYLLPLNSKNLIIFSVTGDTLEASIELTEIPRGFIAVSNGSEGESRSLVTNVSSEVDMVDLTNLKVVDQKNKSGNESYSSDTVFHDQGAKSSPKIVNLTTADGITKSENWVLTYEGIVAGTYSQTGNISSSNLNDSLAKFQTFGVIPGDMVIIGDEEIQISQVSDEQNLVLESTPSTTGSDIQYEIRSSGNYVVFGSLSGLQKNRIIEGAPYSSDTGSFSLSIAQSLDQPTTIGDFFDFGTDNGIESIALNKKMLPSYGARVLRQSDGKEFVYIANESSNNISVIEVAKNKESKTIQ
jgi:hypothetical protein